MAGKRQPLFCVLFGLITVSANGFLAGGAEPPNDQANPVINETSKQELAIGRIRKLGGKVRLFHQPDHPEHWIQIILEDIARKEILNVAPAGEVADSRFDDSVMSAIRFLAEDAPVNLHLRDTRVTNLGLRRLRGTQVRKLALSGESTNDDSLRELKDLPQLKILYVEGTSVTNDGLSVLVDCQALETIGLRGEQLTNAGLEHISQIQKLKSLSLSKGMDDDAAVYVNRLTNLKDLEVPTTMTSAFFRKLTNLSSLSKLTISGEYVDDASLQFISQKATHLKQLYVRRSKISDDGLKSLAKLKNLEVLCFDGCPVTDVGIRYLEPLPGLRWLDLSETQVTDTSLASIGKMKEMRSLFLMNTEVSNAGLEHLRNLPNLRHLSLQNTQVESIPDWLSRQRRLYISN